MHPAAARENKMPSAFDETKSKRDHAETGTPSGVAAFVDTFTDRMADEEGVSSRILTVPNVISFCRLLLIPVFLYLLIHDCNLAAACVFAFAALSDSIDGYIARTTHSISKLGQILDPAVDRLLMVSGAVGLIVVGRLPVWVVILVLVRDLVLLCGGAWLLRRWSVRIPVIFAGKVVTTFLFTGFALLLVNWPQVPGLGITELAWLPGFTQASCSAGIWFVYAGLVLGIFTTSYYVIHSIHALRDAKDQQAREAVTV